MKATDNLQTRINDFWHAAASDRMSAANAFTEELYAEGIDLMTRKAYHPDYFGDKPRRPIAEIIADYLLRGQTVAEKAEEAPAYTMRHIDIKANDRNFTEVRIYDRDPDSEPAQPIGTISLNSASLRAYTPEPDAITTDDLIAAIMRLQGDLKRHSVRIARQYGKEPGEVRQALRKLKAQNAKECRECFAAFYANDRREVYCSDKCRKKADAKRKDSKKVS